MSKAPKFRVGQTVQSAFDASHTFVIDKSKVPARIFHEKGTDRWWTRSELQRLGAPENLAMSLRLTGREKMRHCVPNASPGSAHGPALSDTSVQPPQKRVCPICRKAFEPTRPWQRFDTGACRRASWKRSHLPSKLISIAR